MGIAIFFFKTYAAGVFLKHNQANFGGKPDNSFRPAFTVRPVTALYYVAQRQCFLFWGGFHGHENSREEQFGAIGDFPDAEPDEPHRLQVSLAA